MENIDAYSIFYCSALSSEILSLVPIFLLFHVSVRLLDLLIYPF